MLQDGLKKGPALVAGRLLIEHAGLDDLLIHIEFILGSGKDFLLYTVDRAQTQHSHLILLTNTVGSVLSLQILETQSHVRGSERVSLGFSITL